MASQKISSFTAQSLLDNSDLFTFVRSGTNYNVPFSSLKADLGVTGSIKQAGDPLGAPVLNSPSAGEYEIRNLESSKGIIASVSAQNGINLSCSFTQPVAGGAVNLIEDLNAPIYNFRGIKTEEPISGEVDENGFIVISQSTSPLAQTNTVVVSDITDFPAPVGGVITLEDDTNYILVQPITTSNRFVCGANGTITANNPFSPFFTYTGSDTFFTGIEVNFAFRLVALNCPNGTLFNFSSPLSASTLGMDTVTVISCDTVGFIDDLRSFNVTNVGVFSANQGLTVTGVTNWSVFSATKLRIESSNVAFVAIDFTTSLHQAVELPDLILRAPVGAVGVSGLTNSGNIVTGDIATVNNGEFSGGITPLSGITNSDVRWDFSGNSGIADSRTDSIIGLVDNALATNIIASSTDGSNAVKVNGVWTDEGSSRFSADSTGRITYIGERGTVSPLDATLNVEMDSGSNDTIAAYLVVNDVVIRASEGKATVSSSQPGTIVCQWQYTFSEGDYLELWLENQTDSTDIVALSGALRVN